METLNRKLTTVYTPRDEQGFLGRGHTARRVIGVPFAESDPFILLMDDMLDKKDDEPAGGPHPHAGFQTVTLVLEGEIGLGANPLKKGDFEIMTAGSGIVHTEIIDKPTKMRILQLWLNLPKKDRDATPDIHRLKSENVPSITRDGVDIRVYSGALAGVASEIPNHTPLIVGEIRMKSGTETTLELPADFSTFLYVTQGSIQVGDDDKSLRVDQVGWLDRNDNPGESQVKFTAGENGAHFLLYAAEPQRHEIVSHGPFISDSMERIKELYAEYRAGKIRHIEEVVQ